MARWTKTHADLIRIATAQKDIPISGIVQMSLTNGMLIEGVIRRMSFGNNAGEGGWSYYGEYELENIDGRRFVIDVLDIESAQNVWEQRHSAYEDAGLINIVN